MSVSVLIHGMELPDPDHICLVEIDSDGNVFAAYDGGRTKLEQYKAVPIPPHGRLIDADDFIKKMEGLVHRAEADGYDLGAAWYKAFIRHIELATTIISAEGGA